MRKLRLFYYQNKTTIWKIIGIIAFIIILIQLLNYFAMQDKIKTLSNIENNTTKNIIENTNISNNSAVSGTQITQYKKETVKDTIEKFIECCNNQDIENAYEFLSKDCKEQQYPTIKDFYSKYYSKIFKETKGYSIENWVEDIYVVKYLEDMLATGKSNNNSSIQDYITIVDEEDEKKLNINSYIGKTEINEKTENEQIEIKINYKRTYMDYEIYNLKLTNNSGKNIMLDTLENTDNIYLQDENGIKYISYSHELLQSDMIIKDGFTEQLEIKFTNSFVSSREMEYLVFSNMILDYDEYNMLENKEEYENIYKFVASI